MTSQPELEDGEILFRCFFRDSPESSDAAEPVVADFDKRKTMEAGISLLRQKFFAAPGDAAQYIVNLRKKNSKAIGVMKARWKDVKRVAGVFEKVSDGHVSIRTPKRCSALGERVNDRTCEAAAGICYFDVDGNADELTKLLGQFELELPAKFYEKQEKPNE